MSAASEETHLGPAGEIEARAAAWLEQRHFGTWNEQSQSGLDAWLAESLAHRLAYVRLNTAWDSTQRLAALRRSGEEGAHAEKPHRNRPVIFRLAMAALAVAAIGAGAAWLLSQPHERTYVTALGERETVTLADGSQIELNTDTTLRVFTYANRRVASLDRGEAYFEIKHNAAMPFTVMADNHRVTDLGTKFLVRRNVDRFEVAVVEGRVRLDSSASDARTQPTLLAAGDSAIATADAVSVTKKPARKLANELGWRQGVLVFDNTTLADAAAEFNRYNSNKLVLADNASAHLAIVGTFKTNDVAAFAEIVQDILRLHVVRRGDETVITR